jgi:hypothetical protein
LINALVTAVGVKKKKEALKSLAKLEEIWN